MAVAVSVPVKPSFELSWLSKLCNWSKAALLAVHVKPTTVACRPGLSNVQCVCVCTWGPTTRQTWKLSC